MAKKKKSAEDKQKESEFRVLTGLFTSRGVQVRRENLARGSAFRVKSGTCALSGDDYIFIDKRLPVDQQLTILVDHIVDLKDSLSDDEVSQLPETVKTLLAA